MVTPNTMTAYRMFAVQKIHPQVLEPRSIAALEQIGRSNMALTKEHGLDYEALVRAEGKNIA